MLMTSAIIFVVIVVVAVVFRSRMFLVLFSRLDKVNIALSTG